MLSRASAVPAPVRSEVTNWSQIETRVSDKLYSLARELTPFARYTVLRENTRVGTRTLSLFLSLHITIDKSLEKCFRKFSEYLSWIVKKQEEVRWRISARLLDVHQFQEVFFRILKDPERLRLDRSVIHRKCFDNLVEIEKQDGFNIYLY